MKPSEIQALVASRPRIDISSLLKAASVTRPFDLKLLTPHKTEISDDVLRRILK